jgi:H2-forming N5,N10-methylenetetrahydromethanopterin dehydrogenase-like enzyme
MVQESDDASHIQQFGEVVTGDLLDLDRMKELCTGIDTVVHMAGDPDPSATWQSLLDANIIGTYNTFVAAKAAVAVVLFTPVPFTQFPVIRRMCRSRPANRSTPAICTVFPNVLARR